MSCNNQNKLCVSKTSLIRYYESGEYLGELFDECLVISEKEPTKLILDKEEFKYSPRRKESSSSSDSVPGTPPKSSSPLLAPRSSPGTPPDIETKEMISDLLKETEFAEKAGKMVEKKSKAPPGFEEDTTIIDTLRDSLYYLITNKKIEFPWRRKYHLDPRTIFNNIAKYTKRQIVSHYFLRSYITKGKLFVPPLFRGKPLVIHSLHIDTDNIDVLSDLFIEEQRLSSTRWNSPVSVIDGWTTPDVAKKIVEEASKDERFCKDGVTYFNLRESIYKSSVEAKSFRPTWCKSLLDTVFEKKSYSGMFWLDISAGWGDRLLTAMALGMNYTGYDPNTKLIPAHSEMISMFGNPKRHKVVYEPFEEAKIEKETYDVVLTSPPYFDVEVYDPSGENQSINKYKDKDEWMVRFLFKSLLIAWDALKVGGYMILHVGDNEKVVIAEAMNIFIDQYLKNSQWEGVVGVSGNRFLPRPVWIWRKVASSPIKWNPTVSRKLETMYPGINLKLL